ARMNVRRLWSIRSAWIIRLALPFLTLLAPSKRFYADKTRAPKTLLDWARQAALQIHRWLPDRYIVKAPSSGAFLSASLMYFCSGKPMHFRSGVDIPISEISAPIRHVRSPEPSRCSRDY